MEKSTVLARLRLTIRFRQEAIGWLNQFSNYWFASDGGNAFFSEFGFNWEEIFKTVVDSEIRDYFSQMGVPNHNLPFIQLGDTYRGSWIMDAAVVMMGTAGTVYGVLKTTSELPEIADGLSELKSRILKKLNPKINDKVHKKLYEVSEASVLQNGNVVEQDVETPIFPAPPESPVIVDMSIDDRPLRALTPGILKSHKIHLSVAVSRDAFVLENLGEEPLQDVQIGLFSSNTERHQWSYGDSYMGNVPLLSAHQTTHKNLAEFRDSKKGNLYISDGTDTYIDCWISDSHGIYLFRFFLEAE